MTGDLLDVAIVGYGPVGQTLAALLGEQGVSVVVFERHTEPLGLPRAIRFDHEAMRIWQRLGIVAELEDDILACDRYEWFGADGMPIVTLPSPPAPSGWSYSYVFHQPLLEAALDRAVRELPTVEVHRGVTVTGLADHGDRVELSLRSTADGGASPPVQARYVVGADGAGSSVRETLGIELEDLGFGERWLVLDVRPHDLDGLEPLAAPRQHCDPRRPYVVVPGGRRHRRWELMLLPGEQPEEFADVGRAWELLEPSVSPGEADIVRHAVYEFRSAVASTMQRGRAFLAGDAAHLMPPHLGEGMCSGLRDANGLAWRLAWVLSGLASPRLLDSYTVERLPHSRAIVELSLAMGRISCELDPDAAAARDAAIRRDGVEPPPFPHLVAGLVADTVAAGTLAVQGVVEVDGQAGRLDDVVGDGLVVVARGDDPWRALGAAGRQFLEEVEARLVTLGDGPGRARDVDGALTAWLDELGASAVVIRPDAYVFGAAADPDGLGELVDELRRRLTPPDEYEGGP